MTYITQSRRTARAVYDFAVDGGAIGSVTLRGDKLPSGAVLTSSIIIVDTQPTSGGAATIRLDSESSGDLLAATAISSAPWSSTGGKRGALTATSAPITTTAERSVVATIAAATLTAGKFVVLVDYFVRQA